MDKELFDIISKSLDSGLAEEDVLTAIKTPRKLGMKYKKAPFNFKYCFIYIAVVAVLYGIKNPQSYRSPIKHLYTLKDDYLLGTKDACVVNHNTVTMEVLRPIAKCSICDSITEVSTEFFKIFD